jgi:hypothetical protein
MSKPRPRKGPKEPVVVRRSASERKPMPADLEAFAGGDEDALWRRPAKRRLNDPRAVMLVPGVANRDARAVYEARERRIRSAVRRGDRSALAIELAEASRLALWRAHSVVGWDVLVEEVLRIDRAEAEALRAEGAEIVGSSDVADEDTIAVWMRAEAGAIEGSPEACVHLRGDRLIIEIPIAGAATGLAGAGRRSTPLAREHANAPTTLLDRPKGIKRPREEVPE